MGGRKLEPNNNGARCTSIWKCSLVVLDMGLRKGDLGEAMDDIGWDGGKHFSKVLSIVALYSKYRRALTFGNLWKARTGTASAFFTACYTRCSFSSWSRRF
jgi:hypothetical protein